MGKSTAVKFTMDHVHIKCHDINKTRDFYEKMFNAKTIYEGKLRDVPTATLELAGSVIIITEAGEGEDLECPTSPREGIWGRYGIGHFGVRVDDLDEAARELKAKGAEFILEPKDIRERVRIAFIRAPEDDVIEIVQRPY
jgi:catechol 2,3-dioxygenase-like lactoylglutathione lyase family enzyme